jgi:hypothetical protein
MEQMQAFESPCDHHLHWAPVDRYQPCFELASGGMATVYLARVTARAGFHRFVALKLEERRFDVDSGRVESTWTSRRTVEKYSPAYRSASMRTASCGRCWSRRGSRCSHLLSRAATDVGR